MGELDGRIHNEVQFCHHPEHCMCHGRCKLTVIKLLCVVCSVVITERLRSYEQFSYCKKYYGIGASKQCRMAFCKV